MVTVGYESLYVALLAEIAVKQCTYVCSSMAYTLLFSHY